LQAPKKESKSN